MLNGDKVRILRYGLGLTQEDLAEKTGLQQAQISAIERGLRFPRPETVVRLAEALGVAPSDLLIPEAERSASDVTALGDTVRLVRTGLGMTQAQLGERVGLDQTKVSAIEHGAFTPDLDVIRRLSLALQLPMDDLLTKDVPHERSDIAHLAPMIALVARMTPNQRDRLEDAARAILAE